MGLLEQDPRHGARRRALRTAAALALALTAASSLGVERTQMPARLLASEAGIARAIVRFKPDAALVRERALSAQATAAQTRSALAQRAAALGARRGMTLAAGAAIDARTQAVIASGGTGESLAAALAADPEVEFAVPDERRRRLAMPDDPLYANGGPDGPAAGQWYLRAPEGDVRSGIDAPAAWDRTTGSADVVVAILDTGVRFDHPDLAGRLLPGHDMVSDDAVANDGDPGRDADASDPGDWVTPSESAQPPFDGCVPQASSWHGTQLAGLIGAASNNAIGMAGVAWNVRMLPVRVLGKCHGSDSDIIAGMRWAAGLPVPGVPANPTPARVLNLSLGGAGACSAAYRSVVSEVSAAGAVVVAAAGNSTGRAVSMPANCPGAVGVAGLRHAGTKVGFSDIGPEIALAAPGGNCVNLSGACVYPLLTTSNPGETAPVAGASAYTDSFDISVGTSFAAPLVAGTAALMLSTQPGLRPADVRALLRSSARPFPDPGASSDPAVPVCRAPGDFDQLECHCTTATCGAGMLDAGAAVAAASSAVPTPVPEPDAASPSEPLPATRGGGGASGPVWLVLLLAASLPLCRRPLAQQRQSPTFHP
jgi:serine protease